ncbi:uncharacterized protein LOC119336037 [Triticum dicoccoides]|uniref:uncharacterized protein LOC119336037 n=1 Tax=Triticum dicoccoides TaxID=85692 RepID=UPI00189163B5|nr:uncharacterized protein LOC119336037 [Triticum dicoccoides]
MEGLDVDDIFHHYRLNPTEVEAVTYYLPRLLSGETLHGADKLIHSVEISGCEPKDLAARYAPAPQAVSSGDRFFFTTCKSKNGSKLQSVRGAGGGTWSIQKTTEICHAGCKVGEVKNLSFKKQGKSTGWVMEEYRCLLPEAIVSDGVKVFCKMHLAQHAPDAARQESQAYKLQQQQPEAVTPSAHAQKRPAPAAAADPHPPRPKKRMRGAVPVPAALATSSFTAAAPVFLPDESVPEADDDMVRFCCTIDELIGSQVEENLPVGATNNIEQNFYLEPEGPQKLFADAGEEIVPLEADELEFLRAILDEEAEEQEREAVSTNDKSSIVQDVATYKPPPIIFRDPSEAEWQDDEGLEKEKRNNAAPDLDAPSLQGQDHLSKPQPCSFDPFEEAWKAEEALENEKRCNAAANLHAGGHSNFFSPASVY